MECIFELEKPSCKVILGSPYSQVKSLFKESDIQIVAKDYFVVKNISSLGGVKHELGLHFSDEKLTEIELFYFELDHIDTDDEFSYIHNQLMRIFGKPTVSALQDGRYPQNHWIIENKFQVLNNQTEERGHSLCIGFYDGAKLTQDGMWAFTE